MGILIWIIVGALAGWLASIIMKTNAEMGAIANIVVGIIGALIGGFVMSLLGQSGMTGFNIPSILVATLGAVIFIAILKMVNGRPKTV